MADVHRHAVLEECKDLTNRREHCICCKHRVPVLDVQLRLHIVRHENGNEDGEGDGGNDQEDNEAPPDLVLASHPSGLFAACFRVSLAGLRPLRLLLRALLRLLPPGLALRQGVPDEEQDGDWAPDHAVGHVVPDPARTIVAALCPRREHAAAFRRAGAGGAGEEADPAGPRHRLHLLPSAVLPVPVAEGRLAVVPSCEEGALGAVAACGAGPVHRPGRHEPATQPGSNGRAGTCGQL
mmetsp:Transcript_112956/g.364677  ORF Transcript_112956/g.364677 Transcript_112956/m.364677 type:complete len:238 (-) Transcript_112956:14-727(-)